jgi:hypothetical protein
MFRDKHTLRQERIDVCQEASGEHGKPEQMDAAAADTFGAVVRVAGVAMRDRLARSLLLARNTGAADAYSMAIEVGMKQLPSVSSQTRRKIRIGEMSVHKMKFVLVNNVAPRNSSVCAACSRPLKRGYLHDLSTSKRYCGIECYSQWTVVSGFVGSIASANSFELAVAWPKLTVDVATALLDSASRDHGG